MNRVQCSCGNIYKVADGEPMVCPECRNNGGTIITKPEVYVAKPKKTKKARK